MGGLSSAQEIVVLLTLKGGAAYDAQMAAAADTNNLFAKSLLRGAAATSVATNRTWLHNQALYTLRRYAFYATLALSAVAYEVIKLGFSYNATVQSAKVALVKLFPSTQAMDAVIQRLYKISTLSPFLFKDVLTSFRTLYPAFKSVGIGAGLATRTIQAVTNALAEAGKTGPGQMTRIGVQLQHLANIGRPTGQIILALARDGLPVYSALRHELGLTGTSLENLATSGLTAKQVITALDKYIETSRAFSGAAFRLATQTLQGNWQMFKDILAQASGRAQGGLFSGLTSVLKNINLYLKPLFESNKPIGLINIAAAIDNALTPSSHIIINLFITLESTLRTIITELGWVAKAVQLILWPFNKLFSLWGANRTAAGGFGKVLGTLITLFVLGKLVLWPFILAWDLFKASMAAARTMAIAFRVVQLVLNGEWAAAWVLINANNEATAVNTAVTGEGAVAAASRAEANAALAASYGVVTVAEAEATGGAIIFNATLLSVLGTIGLVAAAVGVMYLVARKFHTRIGFGPNLGPQRATHAEAQRQHHFEKHQSWWSKTFGTLASGLASGGDVSRGGLTWVGERGPELLNLPAKSQVTPLGRNALGGAHFSITVIPQDIYLNGQKIATVMADVVTGKEARMSGRNA